MTTTIMMTMFAMMSRFSKPGLAQAAGAHFQLRSVVFAPKHLVMLGPSSQLKAGQVQDWLSPCPA